MTREPGLVDDVREVARTATRSAARGKKAAPRTIDVRFAGGTTARLDPVSARDRVWADVLEELKATGRPAYVEIDPKTRHITTVLLPRPLTVTAVREIAGGDLEIDLEISHARHYLRREHPRFEELRKTLERSRRAKEPVLVTDSLDGSAIVDARPARTPRARTRR